MYHEISCMDRVKHSKRPMDSKGQKTGFVLSHSIQLDYNFQCRLIMRSGYGSGRAPNFMHVIRPATQAMSQNQQIQSMPRPS